MFESVGWGEILVLVVIGLFVLGPERLPGAVAWVTRTARSVRDYATGARDQLRSELGPEFEQFRQPLEDLRSLRELDPRQAVRRHLLDPPADGTWSGAPSPGAPDPATAAAADGGATGGAAAGGAPTEGLPAAGRDRPVKPSSAPERLEPGESAPLDPDAT